MKRTLMTALVLPVSFSGLVACSGWVESYCSRGEVYVEYAEGGADCRDRVASDPTCRGDRVLRDTQPSARLDCVVDDITADPDPVAPLKD